MLPQATALIRTFIRSTIPRGEAGQGMVEYALILALIALAVIGVLAFIAPPIAAIFQSVLNTI